VSDFNKERLAQATSFGCETIDLSQGGAIGERIEQILKVPEVDCTVDCVGFEAKQTGGEEQPATVLNQLMEATRAAGKIGIPGLYVTADPGAKDAAAKEGNLSLHFGLGWAKSHAFFTGQTPVLKYNRALMMAILHDRIQIAKAVNTTVITLDAAPQGYADFDKGVARKFVIDPHGSLGKRSM
jgi:glutathione-independent formaldehyde dehydrogenase